MNEQDIKERHAHRVALLLEEHGKSYAIPFEAWGEVMEAMRRDWVAFYGHGEKPQPSQRRNKSARIASWAVANVGATVTPTQLAKAAEATLSTAYAFIRDHPQLFRRTGPGVFVIRDEAAERAAARAERQAVAPSLVPAARVAAETTIGRVGLP